MSYCDKTIGSAIKLNNVTEEQILVAIKPLIVQHLPDLLKPGGLPWSKPPHMRPDSIIEATVLADVFEGFYLKLLRDEAGEPAAINSTFEPYTNPEPLLRLVAPYLVRGSWYAVTDDNGNSGVYIIDPAVADSLRVVKVSCNDKPMLWVVPLDLYGAIYDHHFWYKDVFPDGPSFEQEAPYHIKITALVKAVTGCDWLLPCFASDDWE